MRKQRAVRLHPGDEVEVRVEPGVWTPGAVMTYPKDLPDGVVIDVQTDAFGYLPDVRHNDLR